MTFAEEVYEIVAAIPPGRVLTYGMVASLAGRPQNSRLAGHVLRTVPEGLGLPCHRVVNSTGRTAPEWREQRELLEAEGVVFRKNGHVDLGRHLWRLEEL